MMDRLDLNLLLVFEALMETRSVSRGAERLGMRQPAMSAALARLRVALDDPLFVRTAGAMQPTSKAARIAPGLASALSLLRQSLREEEPFAPERSQRRFILAGTDYTTLVIGPRLIGTIAAEAPGVDLRIIGYDKDDVPALIDRGEIDVALGVFQAAPGRTVRRYLARERFVGVARAGHPALREGTMTLDAWLDCRHALVSVRRDAKGEIDGLLERRGLSRRIALVLPHMLTLGPILKRCDLVSALPERAAKSLADADLAIFDLPISSPEWRIEMLWNAAASRDPGSAWLRARIVASVARH